MLAELHIRLETHPGEIGHSEDYQVINRRDQQLTHARLRKQSGMSREALQTHMWHHGMTAAGNYAGREVDWSGQSRWMDRQQGPPEYQPPKRFGIHSPRHNLPHPAATLL